MPIIGSRGALSVRPFMFNGIAKDTGGVVILVQGGANGATSAINYGTAGGTETFNAGASFSSAQQVLGNNMIACTQGFPDVSALTASEALLSRPSGQAFTLEFFFRWASLGNFAPSAILLSWQLPDTSNLLQFELYTDTGIVRMRNGISLITYGVAPANTTHFMQLTVSGNTYWLDYNGAQVDTGTMSSGNIPGSWRFIVAGNAAVSATAATYWVGPVRLTQNRARPRGTVPTAPWDVP